MKHKKTIALALIGSVLMSLFCCGCTDKPSITGKTDGSDADNGVSVEGLPDDEILVSFISKNGSWGYAGSHTYILADGSVYSSSEQQHEAYFPGEALTDEERIKLLKEYSEPLTKIDKDTVSKLYGYMLKIDPDAEFKYEDIEVCDAGTDLTYVHVNGKSFSISESGERTGKLDDRYAKKTSDLLRKIMSGGFKTKHASIYSRNESYIETVQCPNKVSTSKAKRIITNLDELIEFGKDTGIDLKSKKEFEAFYDPDYGKFDYTVIAVEIVSYPEYLDLKSVTADAFAVSGKYVGFAYLNKPVIDVSDEPVPEKYYVHIAQIPKDVTGAYDSFL